MAHHLPRKKYLSKLHSAEDKRDGGDTLVSNESTESLLTAIANSTKLGISSDFDSAVFVIDSDRKCSATSCGKIQDQTPCWEVPSSSTETDHIADDDETGESENSPVYFDDGSLFDDADDSASGMIDSPDAVKTEADLMDDDVTCSPADVCTHSVQTSHVTNSVDMMPSTSSSGCLATSGSASMSSLMDDDVLNTLLPSAESFANLLNSLESRDKAQTSAGRNSHDQLNIALHQQQQQQHSEAGLGAQTKRQTEMSTSTSLLPVSVEERVCVKEELIDSSYEQKLVEPLMTTSGRNRGRGKATERKYDCQVCGDVAAGYHCGAYVCEACKKFYLRCLKMGASPAFLCPKNSDCEITKDTRSHCQFCRFKKCLQLGMYRPGCDDDRKLRVDFKSISCKVCNAPSSGFHFGAITCEGCKGFFRRMLKEQLHKKFVCTNGENCEIASANRTNCKFCRFAKCLRVGMTLEGTRLGRQSNSVKLSTLMQYQCDVTSRPCRVSESSVDVMMHAGNDDQSDGGSLFSPATRSNSDASSLSSVWRQSRRQRSDQDLIDSSCVTAGGPRDSSRLIDSSCVTAGGPRDSSRLIDSSYVADGGAGNVNCETHSHHVQHLVDSSRQSIVVSQYEMIGPDTSAMTLAADRPLVASPRTIDSSAIDAGSPLETHRRLQWMSASPASPDTIDNATRDRQFQSVNQALYTSTANTIERRTIEMAVSREISKQQNVCEITVVESDADVSDVKSRDVDVSMSPVAAVESSSEFDESGKCAKSAVLMDDDHDYDQLMLYEPDVLFSFLAGIFKELDEIMNRPAELDAVKSSPACMETLWKLVEVPFMHHAKCVLRFIKKLPGFRKLPVDVQIKLAQDSVYPVTLIFHSKYYNLETGEYNWFINTPDERDLVLGILPPFAALGSHFSSTGFALKTLALTDVETAFLAAMSVLTAADGSYVQSSCDIIALQDAYIDAFISYCQGRGLVNRICLLIARLPELKRANIEHCLIAAQVQQMAASRIEMGTLWRELFLSAGHPDVDSDNSTH